MGVRSEVRSVRLIPIRTERRAEREWLYDLIQRHHAAPRSILPSREDLRNPHYRFFRAVALAPASQRGQAIGISGYEIRTRFLVETHKTIVLPEFRGQGWGVALSCAIEEEVRKRGFRKIRTTVYVDNLTMIRIKLAQGYRIEGYHEDHDAPGLHEYSLGKILPPRRLKPRGTARRDGSPGRRQ